MAEDPKLAEFREKNIAVLKDLADLKAKYEGIDPAAVAADRARLAELEKAKPTERITELETQLASEKAGRAETQKRADAFMIESAISDQFLKVGGRPEARAFIVAQSAGQFVVENGQLKSTKLSPDRPGEPMSVTEWLTLQTRENAFCFFDSSGGGANPAKGNPGTGTNVLRNPSPQDLGKFAKQIASGELKVLYE